LSNFKTVYNIWYRSIELRKKGKEERKEIQKNIENKETNFIDFFLDKKDGLEYKY